MGWLRVLQYSRFTFHRRLSAFEISMLELSWQPCETFNLQPPASISEKCHEPAIGRFLGDVFDCNLCSDECLPGKCRRWQGIVDLLRHVHQQRQEQRHLLL